MAHHFGEHSASIYLYLKILPCVATGRKPGRRARGGHQNGLYRASGGVPPAKQTMVADSDGSSGPWAQGQTYLLQETYALCRCHRSRDKPFCDGDYTAVKFCGD